MHGLGNDYVYIDCTNNKNVIDNPSELAKKISDRHFGIGSDGLILICDSENSDFKMRMFNADGSESEMCGNGIRCVGKYVYDYRLTKKSEIDIETLAGVKHLKLIIKDDKVDSVTVDMGIPTVGDKLSLDVLDKTFLVTNVSMGNPHAVMVVDDVANFDVNKYGSII
jgi:diaminopimelate epimerase